MNFEWKKVEGSQLVKPAEFEKEESTGHIWLRKNVTEVEKEGNVDGETVKLWQYDELSLSANEYAEYVKYQDSAKTQADIGELKETTESTTMNVDMLTECILEMSEYIWGE